jgi:hypothetical protein
VKSYFSADLEIASVQGKASSTSTDEIRRGTQRGEGDKVPPPPKKSALKDMMDPKII